MKGQEFSLTSFLFHLIFLLIYRNKNEEIIFSYNFQLVFHGLNQSINKSKIEKIGSWR